MAGKRVCPKGTLWDSRRQKCVPGEFDETPGHEHFSFNASRTVRVGPQELGQKGYHDVTREVEDLYYERTEKEIESEKDARDAAKLFIEEKFPNVDYVDISEFIGDVQTAGISPEDLDDLRKNKR